MFSTEISEPPSFCSYFRLLSLTFFSFWYKLCQLQHLSTYFISTHQAYPPLYLPALHLYQSLRPRSNSLLWPLYSWFPVLSLPSNTSLLSCPWWSSTSSRVQRHPIGKHHWTWSLLTCMKVIFVICMIVWHWMPFLTQLSPIYPGLGLAVGGHRIFSKPNLTVELNIYILRTDTRFHLHSRLCSFFWILFWVWIWLKHKRVGLQFFFFPSGVSLPMLKRCYGYIKPFMAI